MFERYLLELTFALILLGTTLYHFNKRFKNLGTIILNDVAIWTTGLAFGLAPFIYLYSGGLFQDNKIIDVALSYLGIFLFIFGLYIVPKFKFINHRQYRISNNFFGSLKDIANKISIREALFFYSLFFITRLYIGIQYNLFVSGSATERAIINLPYSVVLLQNIVVLFLYTSIVWSVTILLVKKKFLIVPVLILFIEFSLSFFQGRRQMLFMFFILIFVFIALGYRIKKRSIVLLTISLFIIASIIFPKFLTFRNIYTSEQISSNIFDDIAYSLKSTFSTEQNNYDYLENIRIRSYINDWNLSIIKKSGIYSGLNGNVFILSSVWIIPKFIYPSKFINITPEYLINSYTGNYITDSPENLIGYGFADFGLLGALLYGIMFGLILFFVEQLATKIKDKMRYASLLLISSFIFVAFSVEQGLISVFSMIRSSLIILFIFTLVKFAIELIKLRSKN